MLTRVTSWLGGLALIAALVPGNVVTAQESAVKIRMQSFVPLRSDDMTVLQAYAADVKMLTGGSVVIEPMPAGAIVGVADIIDAVDKGLVEGGHGVTHLWSGKHPAAVLFGSPSAGSGVGLDNMAWLSWFHNGGGKELYDRLWAEMKVNVKGIMIATTGPEALGWFKTPIKTMADFRKLRFRTPPGIPGQIYSAMGIAAVSMGGGEILPAIEKGLLDAAEWCCPKPDMIFGFHKAMKHYYMQGLHQNVANVDIYINGNTWKKLSERQQQAMLIAADASIARANSYRILENGRSLKELTEQHGVILHDTPAEYFSEFGEAALKVFEGYAAKNAFFKEVWLSQKAFADVAIPFWAQAQKSNAAVTEVYAQRLKGGARPAAKK